MSNRVIINLIRNTSTFETCNFWVLYIPSKFCMQIHQFFSNLIPFCSILSNSVADNSYFQHFLWNFLTQLCMFIWYIFFIPQTIVLPNVLPLQNIDCYFLNLVSKLPPSSHHTDQKPVPHVSRFHGSITPPGIHFCNRHCFLHERYHNNLMTFTSNRSWPCTCMWPCNSASSSRSLGWLGWLWPTCLILASRLKRQLALREGSHSCIRCVRKQIQMQKHSSSLCLYP